MYIAVVDGGGTAAKAVVFDGEGRALGSGQAGACSWSVDPTGAVQTAAASTTQALDCAGLAWKDLRHWVVGASGAGRVPEQHALCRALHAWGAHSNLDIQVGSDAQLAVLGALAGHPGAVVISGTGSIAMGHDRRGHWARAGGYGYILGDEGSAFAIAVAALSSVLAAADGRQPLDAELRRLTLDFYSIADPQELVALVYRQPLDRGSIAQFSRQLAVLAADGHARSKQLFTAAGKDLAALIAAVLDQLQLDGEAIQASYLGGTFGCGELLLQPLRQELSRLVPSCNLQGPLLPAAAGGYYLLRPETVGSCAVQAALRESLAAFGF